MIDERSEKDDLENLQEGKLEALLGTIDRIWSAHFRHKSALHRHGLFRMGGRQYLHDLAIRELSKLCQLRRHRELGESLSPQQLDYTPDRGLGTS